jgi:hypothetical protein
MLRKVRLLLVALAAGSAVFAGASGLFALGGLVASGSEGDLLCDESGVLLSFTLVGSDVTKAKLTGIDPDCEGASLVLSFHIDPGPDQSQTVFSLGGTGQHEYTFSPAVSLVALQSASFVIIGHDQEPPNKGD